MATPHSSRSETREKDDVPLCGARYDNWRLSLCGSVLSRAARSDKRGLQQRASHPRARRRLTFSPETAQMNDAGPAGLKIGSVVKYAQQWQHYCKFVTATQQHVPGRDGPWDSAIIWKYLRLLSKTCRPATITSKLSMLAHYGARCGHVLPVSKHEQPSLLYKRIVQMRKQLVLDAASAVATDTRTPNAKLAIDNRSVVAILRRHAVTDAASFYRLCDQTQRYVLLSVMQHTRGLRFGHFVHRQYKPKDFKQHWDGSVTEDFVDCCVKN